MCLDPNGFKIAAGDWLAGKTFWTWGLVHTSIDHKSNLQYKLSKMDEGHQLAGHGA